MKDSKREYYEQSVFWDQDYLKILEEREKISEIINIIPSDVSSISDLGCGNGAFINTLDGDFPSKFKIIIGLDSSKEALKYVKTEKVQGSVSNLPFKNEIFDLVTCLEVLKHLTQEDFKKGLSEIQRVSKKYIIVTVPNGQDLEISLVMCPKCYCWFNPGFHVRSFDRDDLYDLFRDFKPVQIREIGPAINYYRRLLSNLYRILIKPLPPVNTICPQCGYQNKEKIKKIKKLHSTSKCNV